MSRHIDLLLTHFQSISLNVNVARSLTYYSSNFYINIGNIDIMKNTDPLQDDIYGITNLISTNYFKERYKNLATLSMYDLTQDFMDVSIEDLDNVMYNIETYFCNLVQPVLLINIVPRQLYKKSYLSDRYATEAFTIFKRYGFVDIGGPIDHKIYIPEYVSLRANDIGAMGIIENEKNFW